MSFCSNLGAPAGCSWRGDLRWPIPVDFLSVRLINFGYEVAAAAFPVLKSQL
jgi:hypothetical protein